MAVVEHDFNKGLTVKNQTRFADYKRFYQNVYAAARFGRGHLHAGGLQQSNDSTDLVNQTDWTTNSTPTLEEHAGVRN